MHMGRAQAVADSHEFAFIQDFQGKLLIDLVLTHENDYAMTKSFFCFTRRRLPAKFGRPSSYSLSQVRIASLLSRH